MLACLLDYFSCYFISSIFQNINTLHVNYDLNYFVNISLKFGLVILYEYELNRMHVL